MVHRPTRNAGLFLLAQISIIAGLGYGLSYIPISPQMLLWLIFTAVVWIGLLAVYVLASAVDCVIKLLDDIAKQSTTPNEKGGLNEGHDLQTG